MIFAYDFKYKMAISWLECVENALAGESGMKAGDKSCSAHAAGSRVSFDLLQFTREIASWIL